jgi:hypothetical protein
LLNFVLLRIILADGRLYLCLTNTLFLFGSIRRAFGPRDLSPFQGKQFIEWFPGLNDAKLGRIWTDLLLQGLQEQALQACISLKNRLH